MSRNKRDTRIINTIRNLMASGITDEAALIDTAAQVIGGGEAAEKIAKAVYDKRFKIFEAN